MHEAVSRFIANSSTGPASDYEFEQLALEIFRHQYEGRPMYRRLCQARGVSPETVHSWTAIPAVPADVFKETHSPSTPEAAPDNLNGPHVFLSSGTSAGTDRRSRHELSTLSTYKLSALTHFRRMVLPDDPGRFSTLVLGPTAETHPQSSLGQMFTWCIEEFASETDLQAFDSDGNVDTDAALAWLEDQAAASEPILVLAISSGLTAVIDALRTRGSRLRLPADSRIVDTGGRKGGRTLSAKGLLKAAWNFLHVPAYASVNEYGMTEMLSQFYDDALLRRHEGDLGPRAKVGPAWTRTVVVDPATLEPVPVGETGILRHVDLANWETFAALQTLDLGRVSGRGFEILGRAAGAESRGCSHLIAAVRQASIGSPEASSP